LPFAIDHSFELQELWWGSTLWILTDSSKKAVLVKISQYQQKRRGLEGLTIWILNDFFTSVLFFISCLMFFLKTFHLVTSFSPEDHSFWRSVVFSMANKNERSVAELVFW